MSLQPLQSGSNSRPGRASELVAAVLPAAGPRATASAQDRSANDRPSVDQLQRERLMTHYGKMAGQSAPGSSDGLRASKAIDAYATVSLVEQRQSLADVLGVSVYA